MIMDKSSSYIHGKGGRAEGKETRHATAAPPSRFWKLENHALPRADSKQWNLNRGGGPRRHGGGNETMPFQPQMCRTRVDGERRSANQPPQHFLMAAPGSSQPPSAPVFGAERCLILSEPPMTGQPRP